MRKRRTILFQIGVVVFVTFLLIMIATEYYLYNQNIDIYLTAKNEMIIRDMDSIKDYIGSEAVDEIIEYWCENPEKSKGEVDADSFDYLYNSGFFELYAEKDESVTRAKIAEFFENADDDFKEVIARDQRLTFGDVIGTAVYGRGYADVYCLRPINDSQAMVISDDEWSKNDLDTSTETDAENESETSVEGFYNKKYDFGQIIDFDSDDDSGLSNLLKNKNEKAYFEKNIDSENDTAYYLGYYPVYDNDKLLYILCIEYDWSDVYSTFVGKTTKNLIRNTILGLVFSSCLILICLFFLTVKPLKKVKETMDLYMLNKSSNDVEDNLSTLKSKNEIGDLAYHFRKLTKEMDRYTEENVSLAADKAKIKTELDLAASIQKQSLTNVFPQSDKYEIFASMTPAKEVGGDFYDIFDIDEDHLGLVIGDVSGKGVPASLLMMSSMSALKSFAVPGLKPSEILSKVNESLVQRDVMNMFVTIWMGILDKKTGVLITSNAGHEYPAVNLNGTYELYHDKHGLVTGAMSGVRYKDHEIQLKKGDTVFVYTDGVPEATNKDNELFGTDRMIDALNNNPGTAPSEILESVKTAVDEFVGDAEQFDDLTMLCITYHGNED